MSRTQCLIEPFRNPPTPSDANSCLTKLFLVQGDLQRQARREDQRISDEALPRLWILAPSASPELLGKFPAYLQPNWLPGIYFLGDIFNSAIIAINELPVVSETLWIRLLGRGQTQRQAIIETLALPSDDRRRDIVLELLSNWKISLEVSLEFQQQEEPELMAQLSQAYLDWKRETESRAIDVLARSLITRLLDRKVGTLSESLQNRINDLNLEQLEALSIALLDFNTVEDLETWLSNAMS